MDIVREQEYYFNFTEWIAIPLRRGLYDTRQYWCFLFFTTEGTGALWLYKPGVIGYYNFTTEDTGIHRGRCVICESSILMNFK